MQLDVLVRLGLLASIWLTVFSLGARTSVGGALSVLRKPDSLLRMLAAMFGVVPVFALVLASTTSIPPAIKFAIVAMSVAPVPPILTYKQMKAGGEGNYGVGLLVAASLASIVLTPLMIELAGRLLGTEAAVTPAKVVRTLLLSTGLPLAAGMLLRGASEPAARAVRDLAQRVGGILLLVILVLLVAVSWRGLLGLLQNGGGLAIAATVAVGLAAGHLIGRPGDKSALALAAASRHPGVALAIAEMSFPDERKTLTAAILLFLLITAPYVRWAAKRPRGPEPASANED